MKKPQKHDEDKGKRKEKQQQHLLHHNIQLEYLRFFQEENHLKVIVTRQ